MKKESAKFPGVHYDYWKTPIADIASCELRVAGVLQMCFLTHFFLCDQAEYGKKTHILTIPAHYPFRIMNNEYSNSSISRYFNPLTATQRRRSKPSSTWQFWNSDMIKELDRGEALSGFGDLKPEEVIHYVVATGDDNIEFIAPACFWEIHEGTTMVQIMKKTLKDRYRMRWSEYYQMHQAQKGLLKDKKNRKRKLKA